MNEDNSIASKIIARLQRVTTSGKFISEIDGLRFIAIGTVVLFHLNAGLAVKEPAIYAAPPAGNILWSVIKFGFHGVEMFFVISGFILAYPFALYHLKASKPVNLKQYFLRRITRLEPPYFLCMIVLYIALIMRGNNALDLFPHLASGLVYLHNVIYNQENIINNVAWSLEIEIQFYILVPLLSKIFAINNKRFRRSVIIIIGIISILIGMTLTPEHRLSLSIVRFLHFFLIGFLIADIYIIDWNERPLRSNKWDFVSLMGWPLLFFLWNNSTNWIAPLANGHDTIITMFFFPVLIFLLYLAVFQGQITNRIITNRWITVIGGMCYTIYLFHNPILGLILRMTHSVLITNDFTTNIVIQSIIVLPFVVVLSSIYFILIEKPCMKKDWYKDLYNYFYRKYFYDKN